MLVIYYTDWRCSRYDNAYPYLVNTHPSLGNPKDRKFQFVSCSGARVNDVLERQIRQLDFGQDAILLSIGEVSPAF